MDVTALRNLIPGSHVCWIVDDPATYLDYARVLLEGAARAGEKPVLFGPEGSVPLVELAPLAVAAADPRVAFLGGGQLELSAMLAMFREQSALARAEGYRRLRVVADMDWLLPMAPTMESIVAFELMLDRHVKELDASIVCAYRTDSFDRDTIVGALSVHPVDVGPAEEEAQFRFVAAEDRTWQLGGEVDVAVVASFEAAIAAAATAGHCVIDVSRLHFIDVGSMRAIAAARQGPGRTIELVGASPSVRRGWELAGFAELAPDVQLIG